MKKNIKCSTGMAVFLLTTTSAFAQPSVFQDTVNNNNVTNNSPEIQVDHVNLNATGFSASSAGIGASSSVSNSYISSSAASTKDISNRQLGNIDQKTVNTGAITTNSPTIKIGDGYLGDGASVSTTAAGAVSSVSLSAIGTDTLYGMGTSYIKQTSRNDNSVTNNGNNIMMGDVDLAGNGASVQVSATGAASSVSASLINIDSTKTNPRSATIASSGDISQSTSNTAKVTVNAGHTGITVDHITGSGASVGIAAVGASSGVSTSTINSTGAIRGVNGNINQRTVNTNAVTANGGSITAGDITGTGASISVASIGASSSVSTSSINAIEGKVSLSANYIIQNAYNTGDVIVNAGVLKAGNVSGVGSSISTAAIGASSAVSFSAIK